MSSKKTQNILLHGLKNGDEKIFKKVYELYYEKLCVYLLSYCNDREKVEDVVQDMFIKLWSKRNELNIKTSLNNYLYRVSYNQLMDKYRQQKKKDKMLSSYYHTAVMRAIEEDPELKLKKLKKLDECLKLLPPKGKVVFVACKIKGQKYRYVSEKLNISIKTVEGHIRRSYVLIKECMNDI